MSVATAVGENLVYTMVHLVLILISVAALATGAEAQDDDGELWQPDGGVTREEWLRCHGLPCDVYDSTQRTLAAIFMTQAGTEGGDMSDALPMHNNGTLDGCIMLSPEQATWYMETVMEEEDDAFMPENGESMPDYTQADTLADQPEPLVDLEQTDEPHHREKRKVIDFTKMPLRKWPTSRPIVYKFDGTHSTSERAVIRGAVRHIEAMTCLRFREAHCLEVVRDSHILVTNQDQGCFSYVGRQDNIPQQLNLHDNCLGQFGITVHEFGHAVGLWHEQMRFDRDQYIRINWDNLGEWAAQYPRVDYTVGLGVSYDYASVMHYGPSDGSQNGGVVMEALDPLFQSSMGQRTGLSYKDARIINHAYCAATCSAPLPAGRCRNNGYEDPNACGSCRCPDGLGGKYCTRVAAAKHASCGGDVVLSRGGSTIVTTPGYGSRGSYPNHAECAWWLRAPPGHNVQLTFQGRFGLYCTRGECMHWVEVRYAGQVGEAGPRFCCYDTPNVRLVSQGSEMLVVLRANVTRRSRSSRVGFQAVATATPVSTPRVAWWCDFEMSGARAWCGLTNDRRDQFDWTLRTGGTRSKEIGPEGAHSGDYYIYIETSNPRNRGDQATLWLPMLQGGGTHCLSFQYHMYGININRLRAFKLVTGGQQETIWSRSTQGGMRWMACSVTIDDLNPDTRLGFVGTRGNGYKGDIALDDLRLTAGAC